MGPLIENGFSVLVLYETTLPLEQPSLKLAVWFVSGGEGVSKLRDHRVEAEDPVSTGPAAASEQTKRVSGKRDPTSEQSEYDDTQLQQRAGPRFD